MKIHNLIFLFLIVSSFQTNAQDSEIKLNIKTGLNYSTIVENNDNDLYSTENSYVTGFHFGIYPEFPIKDRYHIEAGLMYSSMGCRTEVDGIINGEQSNYTVDTELEYIVLNAHLTRYFDGFMPGFYVLAGFFASLGVEGKIEFEGYQGQKRIFSSRKVNWGYDESDDDFKEEDLGLECGIGIKIRKLIIEMSYQHGLVNISPYQDNDYSNKNRVFSFSLGLQFL